MDGGRWALKVPRQGASAVQQLEVAGTYLPSVVKDDRL